MASIMSDPLKIFLHVVASKKIANKWMNAPHLVFKNLPNTNKGDVGEEFVKQYVESFGDFNVEKNKVRTGEWDLKINDKKFEIKTSSEDVSGSCQFDHIRLDAKYDFLLCIGVTPGDLFYDIWSKGEVATEKAGTLVSMASKGNSTFKLTKKIASLHKITELNDRLLDLLK